MIAVSAAVADTPTSTTAAITSAVNDVKTAADTVEADTTAAATAATTDVGGVVTTAVSDADSATAAVVSTVTAEADALMSTGAADDVNKADLYASCINYENSKWKDSFGESWNHFTAAQRKELEPSSYINIKQRCDCTVDAAFVALTESTIVAYNAAYIAKGDGIILASTEAAADFKKAGMSDKEIACAEKAMDTSGYAKKMTELSK